MARSEFDNPLRRLQQQGGDRNVTSTVTGKPGGGSQTRLATAVVVDFISNPANLPPAYVQSLQSGERPVQNSDFVQKMPRNSVIAYVVPDDKIIGRPSIFYPLFSPHLSMPVKAGEQIWVIYEDFAANSKLGYWICRKSTDIAIDDINYTHLDRVNDNLQTSKGSAASFESAGVGVKPGFPPGGSTSSESTLPFGISYDDIVGNSVDYSTFVGEPVPRFSKVGSDFVLQGSNNTLICLGNNSGILDGSGPGTGVIDLVAGRGASSSTAASAVINDRNYSETDKSNPAATEGDRSLLYDRARIMISSNDNPDRVTQSAMSYWSSIGLFGPTGKTAGGGSILLSRANHIRQIASNNGSIMILRDSGSGCEGLIVDSSGNTQIKGKKVSLGNTGSSQPYIRYDEYRKTIESIVGVLSDIVSAIAPIAAGAASAPSGAGVTAVSAAVARASTWTGLDITATRVGYLDKSKSSVISGE
jgi:hypothetical protein